MEANYHLRPSLWVEPLDDFGEGAVQLVEIPSDSEIHDNIAAFWVPAKSVEAGAELEYRYRLHWFKDRQPAATNAARVVNTRVGPGGFSGSPSLPDFRKFVIDFAGGQLPNLDPDAPVEAVVSASRGEVSGTVVQLVPQSGYWRAAFDLRADPEPPVELRCFLRLSGAALTETWSYQWTL
jgi:glucans biosynthesis protein